MWSQKCGMCVYIMYNIIYWWARTKWEHKIILYMRRASKIGFNYKHIHTSIYTHAHIQKKTHEHTHTHPYTIMYLDANTFAPFRSPTQFITCTQCLWYGFVSVCFDSFNEKCALLFSVFLRSSFSVYTVLISIYTHIHTYTYRLARMLLCFC